jgi:thioredoxin-related protein
LNKPEFLNYAKDNLVLLNLDFPRKTQLPESQAKANEAIAQRFKITGFPTVILLDSQGEKIGQTGYQPGGPQKYIEHLKQIMNPSK